VTNDYVTVWKQTDEVTGVYKIKLQGKIRYPLEVVLAVLFEHKLRLAWDKILSDIREVDSQEGWPVLYIASRSPAWTPIANRDFVHMRVSKPTEKGKIVIDFSTQNKNAPEKEGYVRAHTHFSGGLLETAEVPHLHTKQPMQGTLYGMITQADFKGYIPKTVVNWVTARSTADWFESLSKACELHVAGKLQ